MTQPIRIDGKTYHHHSRLVPADGSVSPLRDQSENRQSFFKKQKKKLPLNDTAGAYVPVGGRNLLLVIDKKTVRDGTDEWRLIADTAARLEQSHDALTAQGKSALATLRAIIFSRKPSRSFADVEPGSFIYDVDEFRRRDGTYVAPAWTASCVVHDANHVWQKRNGRSWAGVEAEVACWQLQVDNAAALGLTQVDVDHVKGFIADPEKILGRANSDPFGFVARLWRRDEPDWKRHLPPPPVGQR